MWMDIAQEGEQDPRHSEDEDTVYDRTNPFYKAGPSTSSVTKNSFEQMSDGGGEESRVPILEEQDTRCGLCSWRPHYLQRFANKTMFTVIFTIVGVLHSAIWSYYTANISTLEKRFRMDSISSGVLVFANELAQVLVAILFSYFNFRRNRARLLTLGVALTSLSCFLMATPHFFMGSGKMSLQLLKPSPNLEHTFVTIPDGSGLAESMKLPEALPLVQELEQAIGSSSEAAITSSSISTITEIIINSTLISANISVANVTAASESTNASSSTTSPVIVLLSETTPTPPKPSTPEPLTTTSEEEITSPVPVSLLHDEMSSVWPTCQRDIEHISYINVTNRSVCDDSPIVERKLAFGFIFLANFIFGIACMFYLLSGGPFSEDSTVLPNEIPRIFGITVSIRLMGSFFGYLFGWAFLNHFINPFESPVQVDSRWLGAYWMGWLSLSVLMAIFALVFSLFPRQSPREYLKKRSLTHDTGIAMFMIPSVVPFFGGAELKTANTFPSIVNVPGVFQALFRNRVYLLLTLSTLVHIFVSFGYLTFLPKYLEFMFRLQAKDAALLTGLSSVPFQVAGLMLGGAFIARYLPSTKEISHWSCVVSALQIVILLVISFLGCETSKVDVSFLNNSDGMSSHCSADCECELSPPLPACDLYSGVTYYSPCHAGCEQVLNQTGLFSQCSCLPGNVTLIEGFCPGDGCANGLVAFMVFICLGQFLRGSNVVGRMLLCYKSLQADQRTSIVGFTMMMASLIAVIPSPIVYGSLFESSCLVRENTKCSDGSDITGGEIGNCWLYNDSSLRFTFNLASAAFMVIAFTLDALLWKNREVHNLRIYDGELRQLTSQQSTESNNNRFSTVELRN